MWASFKACWSWSTATPFSRGCNNREPALLRFSETGLNYWRLSEANYWGHNAIIRLAPFIRHCSLPELPGEGPFGGRIVSHDYVEAALMRRAGWQVWLATEIEGNYEECPGNVIDLAHRE